MKKFVSLAFASAFSLATFSASAVDIHVAMYDEAYLSPMTDIHVAMYDEAYPAETINIEIINELPATAAGLAAIEYVDCGTAVD